MRDKLESIIERYGTIERQMAKQDILSNPDKLKELAKEYKQLDSVVITGKEYIKTLDQIIDCETIVESNDTELKELAIDELDLHKKRTTQLEKELKSAYSNLDPWEKVKVSRHPQRPHPSDIIAKLFKDWQPLAGDRNFSEDNAMLGGLAKFNKCVG